ncbi:MAG: ABC transporter ATP-binding protein [Gammaproteobacteria bacterium]|nr:ABC transporter ATP-binding protein [Gammaproteobacteria bacterium]NIR85798.1 ABC transporter ATP-binding protein [Gammaproteobacteria bacterium]NIR90552.1 ABC transporter ATP-binding protein [Gammaproteobacteria bacterium]NIU06933.1 ABC transporter ATP-binding protein [Gammaproteobacteria bacterium]NIV53863.1 ATP-binding cassette domain-containing protein [Gammaproteobacteria bacterium]
MKALSVHNLRKTYRNGVEALKGVDLDVERGDFFALLGPNGAGKSTAIGIISSLVVKTKGEVRIFGYDLDRETEAAKACIGVVPQEFNFNMFERVADILTTQAGYYGIRRPLARERMEKYLRQLGLWDKRDERARELSGGMKRRLMIARALVHEPRLLILDEPTAGVDLEIRYAMWRFLRRINHEGTTIILTTHYLEEAEKLCRNIAIINHGAIIEHDTMGGLLSKLHTQTFVLNLRNPLVNSLEIPGYQWRVLDRKTLEVDVMQGQGINDVFNALSAHGMDVLSMRTKQNRLERLFIDLVDMDEGYGSGEGRPN